MESSYKSAASVAIYLARRPDGIAQAQVGASLPGAEDYVRTYKASLEDMDEMMVLLSDFHNEWKGWGNLLDRVLEDWASTLFRIP